MNSKAPKARLECPPGWIGGRWGVLRRVKIWFLGVKKSKFLVTPVGQNGLPTDPEHAPKGAKRRFSAAGRLRLAGAGSWMALDPFVAGLRGELKSPKGSLRRRHVLGWRPRGHPSGPWGVKTWSLGAKKLEIPGHPCGPKWTPDGPRTRSKGCQTAVFCSREVEIGWRWPWDRFGSLCGRPAGRTQKLQRLA